MGVREHEVSDKLLRSILGCFLEHPSWIIARAADSYFTVTFIRLDADDLLEFRGNKETRKHKVAGGLP